MTDSRYQALEILAREIRISLVKTSAFNRVPHLGSCLSCLDILVYLYWREMKCFSEEPTHIDRDRFILSKGHASPVLLQVLAFKGYYDKELLNLFGKDGSYFHEHPPKPGLIPGVEAATGSLGHGLPMAVGMSVANRIKSINSKTYVIIGDGECNEGSIWESAMIASAQKVGSLTVFVDYNKWQATDRTNATIGSSSDLATKWKAFGWHVQEVDGHSFHEIDMALRKAAEFSDKPSIIVANTIKGKGISFMEDDNNWHYRTPNPKELEAALSELEQKK